MAKFVIAGKKLDITPEPSVIHEPVVAKKETLKPVRLPEPVYPEKQKTQEKPDKIVKNEQVKPELVIKEVESELEKTDSAPDEAVPPSVPAKHDNNFNKTVTIEKFTVKKAGSNKALIVRFDIRKISKDSGDVSGRIFIVLRPDNALENQWLVVPNTPLKDGIPANYNKGQFFSIAYFKPVKFTIKNQTDPDLFKKASIYIFNEQKELIFEKLVNITEAQ